MNKQNRSKLYGMLIGDGNLYLATNNYKTQYCKLTIGHSPKQKAYLEHKIDLLHSIFGGKRPKVYEYTSKGYTNLQTVKTDKYLRQCHSNLYSTGKKVVTRKVLDFLDAHGLALWFMDDGSGTICRNKNGKICGCMIRIATYFSEEEALVCKKWFEETWNISPKFDIDRRNGKHSLRFNTKDSHVFVQIVSPYIVESMEYKINITQEC